MLKILGIARRAKKIIIGTDMTLLKLKKGEVKLIFLANDASEGTKKKIIDKSTNYKVEVIKHLNTKELSKAIGKENIKVIGILDEGFKNSILNQER